MFTKKSEAKSAQEQMMSNPDMMTDMMKKNFSGIVPQVRLNTELLSMLRPSSHVPPISLLGSRGLRGAPFLFADCHGRICELLLQRIYIGESAIPPQPILPHHAAGPSFPVLLSIVCFVTQASICSNS